MPSEFGSNVTPRKFGRGKDKLTPWTCVCGQENREYMVKCGLCTVERKFSEKKD